MLAEPRLALPCLAIIAFPNFFPLRLPAPDLTPYNQVNNDKLIKITASLQYNIHPSHIYHMVLKLFIIQFH